MTTIRKIPTSKIDGNDADSTNTDEIRPFGELAVYTKNDVSTGDVNKLELLMFDGVRTHLRSKVLAKGTFYGGDADSADIGDGIENFDTIKLIPDAELHYNEGSYGNDQYLIIDPTDPNHIHIRAGGEIDDSGATLILGGELSSVIIDDQADGHVSILSRDTGNITSHLWQFNNNGSTRFPTLDVDLLDDGVTAVEALQFANNTLYSVITGAAPTGGNDVKPLVLQGLSGEGGAAGGNIYIWSGSSAGSDAGSITIKAGGSSGVGNWGGGIGLTSGSNPDAVGSDITLTTGTGSSAANSGNIQFNISSHSWQFKPDGTTKFPSLSVDLHTGGPTSVETLKFSDNTRNSVITGPTPAASTAALPLIIQGQKQTGAAGGGIYLWGGDSNTAGGDIEILAGDNGGVVPAAGVVTIRGGADVFGPGGDVTIMGGAGISHGNVTISTNSRNWTFGHAGTTTFPTIGTAILGTLETVECLKFGDNTKQSVITGPTADASTAVKAIIVQGRDQTNADAGDVCLYGGHSNQNAGDINITAGTSTGTGYDAGVITLQAGSNTAGTGGNVSILGGTGSSTVNHGEVTITSGSNTWTFNNDGNITIPTDKDIREPGGSTAISGGNRTKAYEPAVGASAIPVDSSNIYLIDTPNVASTLILPDSKETPIGYEFTVTDKSGNAASKNITITAKIDDYIVSAPSGIVIDTDYGLVTFKNVGAGWLILYGR